MAKYGVPIINLNPDLNYKVGGLFGKPAAEQAADLIASRARAIAPVDTGEFRDSIHTERLGDGAVVIADSDHAAYVEFGVPSHGIPAKHTIHDAAVSLGYRGDPA